MLVVTPVSPAAAPYYFRGQGSGRWVGGGVDLLGLAGAVEQPALMAVLRGCHPDDGHFLPAWKPSRRRAGWDLTLAAPKSVSLLAALAATGGAHIAAAHQSAVDEVVGDFARRLLVLRRAGAPGRGAPSSGLVAAAFDHRVNASGEPHLHTHVLICNLGRDLDGVWSSISNDWWTARHSISAIYQLGLRHHLRARGLDLDWRMREDGLADLAGVPRAAIRAASGRSRAAAAERAALSNQGGGRIVGIRAAATVQTRRTSGPDPWRARAAAAGFGPDDADRMIIEARSSLAPTAATHPAGRDLTGVVTSWLASQRSSFRHTDVLVALAACAPHGLAAREAARWTARFCEAAVPVPVTPTSAPRWTTQAARLVDQRLMDRVRVQQPDRPGLLPHAKDAVTAELADHADLSPEGLAAVRALTSYGRALHILGAAPGRSNLLAQAAVLEVAAAAWRSAGARVSVATSTELAATRWQTLTGIAAGRDAGSADIVVVDHADRRATPDLLAALADIDRRGAVAVLIEGGTGSRLSWMRSDGLARLGDQLGRLDPGQPPLWTERLSSRRDADAGVLRLEIATYPRAAHAAGGLLTAWASSWSENGAAALVGLGHAETDGLNRAARELLIRRGDISGQDVCIGGRVFQAGDHVVALRRLAADLPGGTGLKVVAVDPRRREVTAAWGSRVATLDRGAAAHLGYGYAVTPALAARTRGPLLVLGPPDVLGPHRARVATAAMVAPEPARRARTLAVERDRRAGLGLG